MKYRGEIDGLRALAVVPVILFHAGLPAFGGGFIGVDIFFVISGYLISTIIINELDSGHFSILRFYERRARRILPALFLVMLVSIPFAWFWLMPRDLKDFADSMIAVTFFVSNFLFWLQSGYFETAAELKPLLHTWSLAVEEQYYIIFPILLMLLNPLGKRVVLYGLAGIFIASLIVSHWGIYNRPSATFFLLPARGWELLVGVFAAIYLQRQPGQPSNHPANILSLVGMALIIAPIFLYTDKTPFPGAYALPPTIGTALIILYARQGTLAHRLLGARPLVAIGLVSYSAYLWHQPVFAFYKHRFGTVSFDNNILILIVFSILMATVSYWLVERPFRRRASLRQLGLALAACFVLVTAGTTAFLTAVHDNYRSIPSFKWAVSHATPELISFIEGKDVRMGCTETVPDIGLQYCRFGDPEQPATLALWGDSLAGALLYGIDQVARENGLAGMAYVVNGCPPLPGLRNTDIATCNDKTHEDVIRRINAMPDLEMVMIIGNLAEIVGTNNIFIDGQAATEAALRAKAKTGIAAFRTKSATTVFIEPGPVFRIPVAEYEIQGLRTGHQAPQAIARPEHEAIVADVRALADLFDIYIETADFYCDDTRCPSVDKDGKLIFYDRNHLTKDYSRKLAELIFKRLHPGS